MKQRFRFNPQLVFWGIVFLFLSVPVVHVVTRRVTIISLVSWLGALVVGWRLLAPDTTPRKSLRKTTSVFFLACAIVLGFIINRYVSLIPTHYHHDEFVLAYTSYRLPAFSRIDWFAAYPEVWVNQLSILVFILQKPFIALMGPTRDAIRYSVLLYYPFICIFIYVLGKKLFSPITGVIAVFLYAVFAPSIYLWGIGNIELAASTLVYLATVYWCLTFLSSRKPRHALTTGIVGGLGFLIQPSSYGALPIAILIWGIEWAITRTSYITRGIVKAVAIAGILLAPFITYAVAVNNFFFQRISQVNLFTGSWSRGPVSVWQQLVDAFAALVTPNIGGALGYHFGKQALLEPVTAVLFLVGMFVLIREAIVKKDRRYGYVMIAVILPFLGGMVFTMPPPAFHRIALLFPLIALVCTLPVTLLFRRPLPPMLTAVATGAIFIVFAVRNSYHLRAMIEADAKINPQYMRVIGDYIVRSYPPGTAITVATPRSFKFQDELFFRTSGKYPIQTVEEDGVASVSSGEPILLFDPSDQTREQLTNTFPGNSWISKLDGVPLADPYGQLFLFVPNPVLDIVSQS